MQTSRFLITFAIGLSLIACSTTTVITRVFPQSTDKNNQPMIPVTAPEEFIGCGGPVIPVTNAAFEQAVVEQTNQIRMDAGLSPLKRVDGLDESARYHAADMSNNDYFNHNTLDRIENQLVEVCDTWHRIEAFYDDWLALAENIAAGQRIPEMAMDGWMNSPDHRHNILSDSYWEIGVGFYQGNGEYHYYWVQNFGRTAGRYPLVVEGEKAKTSTREVAIFIYGDWDEMRLRNDDGSYSQWMPFQTSFSWSLPGTIGSHTVTAEVRNRREKITTSDSIELVP